MECLRRAEMKEKRNSDKKKKLIGKKTDTKDRRSAWVQERKYGRTKGSCVNENMILIAAKGMRYDLFWVLGGGGEISSLTALLFRQGSFTVALKDLVLSDDH